MFTRNLTDKRIGNLLVRRLSLLMVGVLLCYAPPTIVAEQPTSCSVICTTLPRPCDQLWVINTRAFPCADPRTRVKDLSYEVRSENGWSKSDLQALLQSNSADFTTVLFVHGNRYTAADAKQEGFQTYRKVVGQLNCERPIRFIIFSWPSQQVEGLVEDVRVKAARSTPNAYYLAWVLNQLGADKQTVLIGHSYGARIITGAMHLLGGGLLNGWTLNDTNAKTKVAVQTRSYRLVLAASALDNNWLLPGRRHGNAVSQTAQITLLNNSCDRALKRYHFLYGRRSCVEALGYFGIASKSRLGSAASKLTQFDVAGQVGKQHGWEYYLCSSTVIVKMRSAVTSSLQPVATVAAKSSPAPASQKTALAVASATKK